VADRITLFWVRDPVPENHPRVLIGYRTEKCDLGLKVTWASACCHTQEAFDRKEAHRLVREAFLDPLSERASSTVVPHRLLELFLKTTRIRIAQWEASLSREGTVKRAVLKAFAEDRLSLSREEEHILKTSRRRPVFGPLFLYLVTMDSGSIVLVVADSKKAAFEIGMVGEDVAVKAELIGLARRKFTQGAIL
jgi:hypothetical protein